LYREVAIDPHGKHHFHTGRYHLARHLGYDEKFVASVPNAVVESFAGVANPFSLQPLAKGERVVDVGSGAGFDSLEGAHQVGAIGKVVGVDMTEEMLAKSRSTVRTLGLANVEFREGLAEALPVEDGWALSSSATASSTFMPTKKRPSRKSTVFYDREGGSSSPTSRTANPPPKRRSGISIFGQLELRWSAVCSLAKNVGRDWLR
jgi:SAM-dependent methyltransferase